MNAFKIQLLQKGLDNMNTGAKIKKLRKDKYHNIIITLKVTKINMFMQNL